MLPNFEIELSLNGIVAGVDEAGRGALCGPVVAAAVIIPPGFNVNGVNDSKKLSFAKRAQLYKRIVAECSFAVGIIGPKRIDEINILQATFEAMNMALGGLQFDYAIIDGNMSPNKSDPRLQPVIKGDSKSLSIAAASIIAKYTRDTIMLREAEKYSQYGFEKHFGYATKLHREAIISCGVTEIHRMTFLRNILG